MIESEVGRRFSTESCDADGNAINHGTRARGGLSSGVSGVGGESGTNDSFVRAAAAVIAKILRAGQGNAVVVVVSVLHARSSFVSIRSSPFYGARNNIIHCAVLR